MSRAVLAIGAHFDDLELGMAGTIARHVDSGDSVTMLVVTDSGYRDLFGLPVRDAAVAAEEGHRAARILGVEDVRCLGVPCKQVTYGWELIERIETEVRRINADVVYTHWLADSHQDHASVGRATLTATRAVATLLMYRSNPYDGVAEFRGTYRVDIGSFVERKRRAIAAHVSELHRNGPEWLERILSRDRALGFASGREYIEAFEPVRIMAEF